MTPTLSPLRPRRSHTEHVIALANMLTWPLGQIACMQTWDTNSMYARWARPTVGKMVSLWLPSESSYIQLVTSFVCLSARVCVCARSRTSPIKGPIHVCKAFISFFSTPYPSFAFQSHAAIHIFQWWRKTLCMAGRGGCEGAGWGYGKKIFINMPQDKCVFSTHLIPCSISTFFPSLCIPQSSHIIPVWPADTNDRAFCHGVWNTLNITCQLRDNNGWQRSRGYAGKARRSTSTYFRLCLNPIIGRLESSLLGWKSMSASLCVGNVLWKDSEEC